VKIETVCAMTCRVDRLGPKLVRNLILVKHDFCHLYKTSILSFGHRILLSSVGGAKTHA
jgi:hypothetical protein